ncbi:Proline iminopeptidase [Penicillium citrinum]|uniref:Proline iminopeptidase n=2 Tax=Penicillium TaxID=5073 RepID=A0A9W9NJU8_PENCI|nr:Proline iminopeptidase [Penicillium citrinum]KAJ5221292.1 Proline iminopeptidase [Penicillium citrinum]KAJ5596261.1 Proline iminopeptidase [Penicillium hetheringtonii]
MAAKLVERQFHNVPGKLRVGELFFDVPVDYSKPNGTTLRLFARSVTRFNKPVEPTKDESKLPWLVYLQGGPGFGCGAPQNYGWVEPALTKGYQILFLDQRGTGLSSTITAGTLARQGDAIKQAQYLKHFRADNIVRDCEAIRKSLTEDYPEDQQKWSIIGQSFGGFCAATYLSQFPGSLREAYICGGLPPLVNEPEPVYSRTYEKVAERNQAYYAKFPEDVQRVKKIMQYLAANQVPLASGWLTPARFQQLGIMFGFHGGIDSLHEIVLRAWNDLEIFGSLTVPTLATIDGNGGMDKNIIYAVLHEAIYCQGKPSLWAADRRRAASPQFQISDSQPEIYFTGEMVFKDMFESYTELKQVQEVAEILANTSDWPALYDEAQLAKNEVPVYAATYIDDMYVHFDLASNTAAKIKGTKQFITNTMYHDALRSKSGEIMRQLFNLRDDSID